MSFLKKALLTAAVTAVGLGGSVMAPNPANAVDVGTVEFVSHFHMTPSFLPGVVSEVGGTVRLGESAYCADVAASEAMSPAATAGFCTVEGGGGFWGNCKLASGHMSGVYRSSAGRGYNYAVSFNLVGDDFTATGRFWVGDRSGPIVIQGTVSAVDNTVLGGPSCLGATLADYTMVATATFGGI